MPSIMNNINRSPTWIQRTFKPFIEAGHDIANTFKPYKNLNDVKEDLISPFQGCPNILFGLAKLIFAPIIAIYDVAIINNRTLSGAYFSHMLNGTSNILIGVGQIIISPITWFLKIPFRGLIITPLDRLLRHIEIKKDERIQRQLDNIKPASLNVNSMIRNKKNLLPTELLTIAARFLSTTDIAIIRQVSKQFYSSFNYLLKDKLNISNPLYYYMIGKTRLELSGDKLYSVRDNITKEELLTSFKGYNNDDEVLLFPDENMAKEKARSLLTGDIPDGDLAIHPVYKVAMPDKKDEAPMQETLTIFPGVRSSSVTRSEKKFEVSYFRTKRQNIILVEGEAVDMNCEFNYPTMPLNYPIPSYSKS